MGSKTTHRRAQTQLTDKLPKPFRLLLPQSVAFLRHIVIGDTMWIRHYEPESKCQSMGRKHPTLPITTKVKTGPSGGKLTLTLFWDLQGSILVHSQDRGITVSRACYSEMFWDW
jgi:hypothetical protein